MSLVRERELYHREMNQLKERLFKATMELGVVYYENCDMISDLAKKEAKLQELRCQLMASEKKLFLSKKKVNEAENAICRAKRDCEESFDRTVELEKMNIHLRKTTDKYKADNLKIAGLIIEQARVCKCKPEPTSEVSTQTQNDTIDKGSQTMRIGCDYCSKF